MGMNLHEPMGSGCQPARYDHTEALTGTSLELAVAVLPFYNRTEG